jgi:hypothetical protein
MKGGSALTLSEFRHSLTGGGTVVASTQQWTRHSMWKLATTPHISRLINFLCPRNREKAAWCVYVFVCLSVHTPHVCQYRRKLSHDCIGAVAVISTAVAHCTLTEFSDKALRNYKLHK